MVPPSAFCSVNFSTNLFKVPAVIVSVCFCSGNLEYWIFDVLSISSQILRLSQDNEESP